MCLYSYLLLCLVIYYYYELVFIIAPYRLFVSIINSCYLFSPMTVYRVYLLSMIVYYSVLPSPLISFLSHYY